MNKISGGFATNNRGRKLYDNKGYEAGEKDLWRMRDMRTRAKGDDTKLLALARQMAKSIKDAEKAFRRADAAAQIFDGKIKDQIVSIFMEAAESLSELKVATKHARKLLATITQMLKIARKPSGSELLAEIAKTVDGLNLVDMRKPLEALFSKGAIDFSFQPQAHFRIKHKGRTIVIINKQYAEPDEDTVIAGDYAIGYMT